MSNIIVIEHITLDGVIQSPGSKDEDTSNGFSLGGWISKYSDELLSKEIRYFMDQQFDLLLGRKTYDIWSKYWPNHNEIWRNINKATKYLVSSTIKNSDWEKTIIINKDNWETIEEIKKSNKNDIHIWGSGVLVQTLLKNRLIDRIHLFIYPIILGEGKTLFNNGIILEEFILKKCISTKKGVIITEYNII